MTTEKQIHQHTEDALDVVLRQELRWQAPPELTNQLLSMVQQAPAFAEHQHTVASIASPVQQPARPGTWYSLLVMVLTSIAVGLSLAMAWQVYGVVVAELGLAELWYQTQAVVASALQWLYTELPVARRVVPLFGDIYAQTSWLLNWLLAAVVLWLALDSSTPERQQQRQSI